MMAEFTSFSKGQSDIKEAKNGFGKPSASFQQPSASFDKPKVGFP